MTLRRAAVGDEHTLAALNRFVHDMHHARRPDYYRATRVEDVAAWFRDRLENPLPAAWIEEDGAAVGYVVALFFDRPDNPFRQARRWCEIDQIAARPLTHQPLPRLEGDAVGAMTPSLTSPQARRVVARAIQR